MTFAEQWAYTGIALHEINESIKNESSFCRKDPLTEEEIMNALSHWDDFCNLRTPNIDQDEINLTISRSMQGKTNAASPITIIEKRGRKRHTFVSKKECMEYLKISAPAFSRFLKGESKLNNIYTIEKEDH